MCIVFEDFKGLFTKAYLILSPVLQGIIPVLKTQTCDLPKS